MANGDGAAVGVHMRRVVVQAPSAGAGQGLGGERLVQFNDVEVAGGDAQTRGQLLDRRDRTDAHDPGRHTASRAAVDAGYADHDRQIGQTGVTVRPKLYIACGISGQIQHIAGMQESGIIISVNNDENAPINAIADYVINGTVEEVIPKMIKYYKQNSK